MTKEHAFTRGNIVSLTGVPNDVFTFWLRSSLIRPGNDRERANMRLRFSKGQVRIAAVLNQARKIGLNVDALRAIADTLDKSEAWIAQHRLTADDFDALIDLQQHNYWSTADGLAYLAHLEAARDHTALRRHEEGVQYWRDHPPAANISAAIAALVDEDRAVQSIAMPLLIDAGIISLHKGEDDAWIVASAGQIDGGLPADACVMIDLERILPRIDWPAK